MFRYVMPLFPSESPFQMQWLQNGHCGMPQPVYTCDQFATGHLIIVLYAFNFDVYVVISCLVIYTIRIRVIIITLWYEKKRESRLNGNFRMVKSVGAASISMYNTYIGIYILSLAFFLSLDFV